jgi:hypothetical protein
VSVDTSYRINWQGVAQATARGSVRLHSWPDALLVATTLARTSPARWFVCKRLNAWYVLDDAHATAARGNPAWPGKDLA